MLPGERIISLASGVLPEFPPEQAIVSAATAGFNAVGIWYDAETWSSQRTQHLAEMLTEHELIALDIEAAWFHPGEPIDAHDAMIEAAIGIGARNILCVSSEPELLNTQRRFEHLCRQVEGTGIRVALEFLAITEIRTLQQALEVVSAVNHPAAAILIDALHLQRNNGCPADLKNLDPNLLPYMQLCDAALSPPGDSMEDLLEDALYQRQLPGEGELPLTELLSVLDDNIPISLEIRSRQLMEQFPDPNKRAEATFRAAKSYFSNNKKPSHPKF